jgi:hypothetical protein
MVQAAQPKLMERVASFLLASGPLWSPPPPPRLWLPHSHLYSSPKRFPVESHLLLGCFHKIPNRASVTSEPSRRGIAAPCMAFDLPRCSTVASNTTLGPCSQGTSRHVLPHAAPGFFIGRGRRDRWSSLNFASILLALRDDAFAPCSGGRTQDQGMSILSSSVSMVFLLGSGSEDPGHLFIAVELSIGHHPSHRRRGNLIYNTVCTWSTRSLSAIRSTDMSVVGMLTSFQSSSSSGGSSISAWDKVCACTVHPWVATRQ